MHVFVREILKEVRFGQCDLREVENKYLNGEVVCEGGFCETLEKMGLAYRHAFLMYMVFS